MLLLVDGAYRSMFFRLCLGVVCAALPLLVCGYGCIHRYVGASVRAFGGLIDWLALLWKCSDMYKRIGRGFSPTLLADRFVGKG